MTQDQKQIAIMKACGWRLTPKGTKPNRVTEYLRDVWASPDGNSDAPLPDVFHDLNACHEMEKALDSEQSRSYAHHLLRICGTLKPAVPDAMPTGCSWHATAAQRAEAFGLTLNLW